MTKITASFIFFKLNVCRPIRTAAVSFSSKTHDYLLKNKPTTKMHYVVIAAI